LTADTEVPAVGRAAGDEPVTEEEGSFDDPVFVLCNGRSGSTLLRFLLDAHPELACPPETNLPMLCVQLTTVWSLIEGGPLSATRGDEPPEPPEAAIAGVRATIDRMIGSYLARRGKKRYCDKSLGTARYAELLLRVYPGARFICMYRHPMDVVASGIEACPWGLNGYGFEPYVAATPGNTVQALASFWADNVRATLAVEERFPDQCFRLRYEDLVADPERIADRLFEFLGVAAAPGISQACFSGGRERFGPADHKIWYTSKISSDSVGRGWSVPSGMIAPEILGVINEMAGKLGYLAVDGGWGTTEPPADLRVPSASELAVQDSVPARRPVAPAGDGSPRSERLGERLRAGLADELVSTTGRPWGPHGSESFVVVAVPGGRGSPAEYWHVDLRQQTVTRTGQEAQEASDWDMIGALDAWEKVISHQMNLSVALRSCQIRYCDNDDADPVAGDIRIGILGRLLGLAAWR
jgi:hypothetical protein